MINAKIEELDNNKTRITNNLTQDRKITTETINQIKNERKLLAESLFKKESQNDLKLLVAYQKIDTQLKEKQGELELNIEIEKRLNKKIDQYKDDLLKINSATQTKAVPDQSPTIAKAVTPTKDPIILQRTPVKADAQSATRVQGPATITQGATLNTPVTADAQSATRVQGPAILQKTKESKDFGSTISNNPSYPTANSGIDNPPERYSASTQDLKEPYIYAAPEKILTKKEELNEKVRESDRGSMAADMPGGMAAEAPGGMAEDAPGGLGDIDLNALPDEKQKDTAKGQFDEAIEEKEKLDKEIKKTDDLFAQIAAAKALSKSESGDNSGDDSSDYPNRLIKTKDPK
jgi:hypothetical protein